MDLKSKIFSKPKILFLYLIIVTSKDIEKEEINEEECECCCKGNEDDISEALASMLKFFTKNSAKRKISVKMEIPT